VEASEELLLIKRTYFNQEVWSYFYKGKEEKTINLNEISDSTILKNYTVNCAIREEGSGIVVVMRPQSFVFLEIETKK